MSLKVQALVLVALIVLVASQGNQYCSTFTTGNVCIACYQGYYINSSNICIQGSGLCKSFTNDGTGNCAICWDGSQAPPSCTSASSSSASTAPPNPWCSTFAGNTCTACYAGYYINTNNICTFGNSYCKTFTTDGTGNCAQCWDSSHTGLTCSVAYVAPIDYYCIGHAANGKCTTCEKGYYLNNQGVCTLSNPCPTISVNNVCPSPCWVGYTFSNGVCTLSPNAPVDPYCASFSSSVCNECSLGYYFDSAHVCTPGDRNCYVFTNDGTGACSQCYVGSPVGGYCSPIDPKCIAYSLDNCVACSTGFTVGSVGICVPNTPRCYTYASNSTNSTNSTCSACYPGEIVSAGVCVRIPAPDPYCTINNGTACIACELGMYIAADGYCYTANIDCASFNLNGGDCTSCNHPLHLSIGISPVLCISYP